MDNDFQRYQLAGADSTILESWPVLAKNVQKRTLYVSAPIPINASMYDNQYFRGFLWCRLKLQKTYFQQMQTIALADTTAKPITALYKIMMNLASIISYTIRSNMLFSFQMVTYFRLVTVLSLNTLTEPAYVLKQLCVNISKLPTFIAQKAMQNEWIARIVNTILQVNTG
ncbi:hypothetical protein SS50377_28090 [Spironucleus salmonicida]|uniref:Uncharacterized protein n=1 Tax=Spironucleus salmonicida TaxID=348837 RepID=V6LDS9_9EUKA|nr:hypothetical protein SS50377_28090 [Spironucleus salmonicida]|eukprot:EST42642.1 Hypothetical protein SS50377_17962 [Spironucleus salmonicida]